MNSRIKRSAKIEFNNRENDFLMLATNFYKSARYNRFNINTSECKEANLFVEFVKKHLKPDEIEYHFITGKVMVNEKVKNLVGRTLGSIANKYYSLIREGANKNGTYTYELLSDSKAEKIFLGNYRNKSLQEMKITESIAVKELIACIRNTEGTCAFLRFLDEIEPLDIDVNLINEYLSELSMGNIPQTLIDEVETLYEEIEHPKNRIELISLIGDTCVAFEFSEIQEVITLINDYISGKLLAEPFAKEIEEKYDVSAIVMSVENMSHEDATNVLQTSIYEFPVSDVEVITPSWIAVLEDSNPVKMSFKESIEGAILQCKKVKDAKRMAELIEQNENVKSAQITNIDTSTGVVTITLEAKDGLYEQVLNY